MSDKKNQPTSMPQEERKEPLPWEKPKSPCDDPECPVKIQKIMDSPSYIPAVEDVDFLDSDTARGVRLQLDYLKPDKLLKEHGIHHTIVVFGSTRIVEPSVARKKVETLQKKLAKDPRNKTIKQKLSIAERILAKSPYYDIAREFSRLVTISGDGPADSRLVIMTGGGPGMMEAANRGAHDEQGETVGLNITLPKEQYPNPYVTPELCFQFHYFSLRKMHFMLRARALVAFPGGYGTFDELFETLTLIQTRKITPIPVVLVGKAFWEKAFNVDFLVEEGVIDEEDRDLFWYAETAEDIWQGLNKWYAQKGESLISAEVNEHFNY